jgi:hypothetical protein
MMTENVCCVFLSPGASVPQREIVGLPAAGKAAHMGPAVQEALPDGFRSVGYGQVLSFI